VGDYDPDVYADRSRRPDPMPDPDGWFRLWRRRRPWRKADPPKPPPSPAAIKARARRVERKLNVHLLGQNPTTNLAAIVAALAAVGGLALKIYAGQEVTSEDLATAVALLAAAFGLSGAKDKAPPAPTLVAPVPPPPAPPADAVGPPA
jgi:hypothetical protein